MSALTSHVSHYHNGRYDEHHLQTTSMRSAPPAPPVIVQEHYHYPPPPQPIQQTTVEEHHHYMQPAVSVPVTRYRLIEVPVEAFTPPYPAAGAPPQVAESHDYMTHHSSSYAM